MKKIFFFIVNLIIGFCTGAILAWKFLDNIIEQLQFLSDKHLKLFKVMNLWVNNFQENKYIGQYLWDKKVKEVAIYGMGIAGTTLYRELKNSKVKVCYGIDQSEKNIDGIRILNLDDQLPEVDAIIVTPVTDFRDISVKLEKKIKCKIMSLEEILLDM